MLKRFLTIIFISLFFLVININAIFCINYIDNKDNLVTLDLYVLESKFDEGKFIIGNPESMGFTKYNGEHLVYSQDYERHMFTFKGEFYVDEKLSDEFISLYVGPAAYAYNIYYNGVIIYKAGRYKDKLVSSTYKSNNVLLSKDITNYGKQKNEIAIQIYPINETHPFNRVSISSFNKISLLSLIKNLFIVNLIQAIAVVAFILFLYFMSLAVLNQFRDKRFLYFAMLCFFFLFCYVNIIFQNNSMNEVIFNKITRISFPLATLFMFLFNIEYTGILKNRIKIKLASIGVISTVCSVFVILTIIQSTKQAVNNVFSYTSKFFLLPVLVLCLIFLIYNSFISIIRYKKPGSFVILSGFIILLIASIYDIIYVVNSQSSYIRLTPYGYTIFVISIFFVLSLEQSSILRKFEISASELKNKNISLNKMMINIEIVTQNIITTSKGLEENVNTTLNVVEDYRKSNKYIMDKLIKQFEILENMINQVANRLDTSFDKIPRAIDHQTSAVKKINSTISEMNSHIEATYESATQTSETANKLSEIANKSTKIVKESKKAVDKITEYSSFLNDVLNTIQDITEKTNLLSINASIQAANSGEIGKGFSVIAGEIRTLAIKSKASLTQSFENISDMEKLINASNSLSDNVSNSLSAIIDEARTSAIMINHITGLLDEQKDQSALILKSVKSLLKDTYEIKSLSDEEQNENENIKKSLMDLKNSFVTISDLLKEQGFKELQLFNSLENIKNAMLENLENVDILNESLKI